MKKIIRIDTYGSPRVHNPMPKRGPKAAGSGSKQPVQEVVGVFESGHKFEKKPKFGAHAFYADHAVTGAPTPVRISEEGVLQTLPGARVQIDFMYAAKEEQN